jgi:malonyl-CoA decarboxylase
VNVSFLQVRLNTVAERGRQLVPRALITGAPSRSIGELSEALVAGDGEASGIAIARRILVRYRELDEAGRRDFFLSLADRFGPDLDAVRAAAERFVAEPAEATYTGLVKAVEPPRQELFRRLNLAPGATADLVAMRADLQRLLRDEPRLRPVDRDFVHLLSSWFNRGFLVLRRIDWSTPANILEKIIAYEAVHEIQGWDDLRRRLDPHDRRCFAFFHPALVDEPLIFVEVALMRDIPGSIQALLGEEQKSAGAASELQPTTAVFYSISNCQEGLRGISFGNFLIKQVVEDLARELPSLKTFVTLSPVPGFGRWLARRLADPADAGISEDERVTLQLLDDSDWIDDEESSEAVQSILPGFAAEYLMEAKDRNGRPVDPVARFHLGNGARLERINWRGDVSAKGLADANGIMVNYLYELKEIERNHEAYANTGTVTASRAVRSLLRSPERSRQSLPVPMLTGPRAVAAPAPPVANAREAGSKSLPGTARKEDGAA